MALIFGKRKKYLVLECNTCANLLSFNEDQILVKDKITDSNWPNPSISIIFEDKSKIGVKTLDYFCPVCNTYKNKSFYNEGLCTWIDDITFCSLQNQYKNKQ